MKDINSERAVPSCFPTAEVGRRQSPAAPARRLQGPAGRHRPRAGPRHEGRQAGRVRRHGQLYRQRRLPRAALEGGRRPKRLSIPCRARHLGFLRFCSVVQKSVLLLVQRDYKNKFK